MRTAAESGDWKRVGDFDLIFHANVAAFAGSARLDEFYRRLLAELRLRLASVDRGDEHLERWVEDHEALLEALIAGQTKEALRIAEDHLSVASDAVQPPPVALPD